MFRNVVNAYSYDILTCNCFISESSVSDRGFNSNDSPYDLSSTLGTDVHIVSSASSVSLEYIEVYHNMALSESTLLNQLCNCQNIHWCFIHNTTDANYHNSVDRSHTFGFINHTIILVPFHPLMPLNLMI